MSDESEKKDAEANHTTSQEGVKEPSSTSALSELMEGIHSLNSIVEEWMKQQHSSAVGCDDLY